MAEATIQRPASAVPSARMIVSAWLKRLFRLRAVVFALIFSCLYDFFLVVGMNIQAFEKSGLLDADTYLSMLCWFPLIFVVTLALFWLIDVVRSRYDRTHIREASQPSWLKPPCFFVAWVIMILAWSPFFLAFFPGSWAYDATFQTQFLLTGDPISDHHPVVHTLWLSSLMELSHLMTGSYVPGVAVHTITQIVLLSGLFTLIVWRIAHWHVHMAVPIFIYLFFCFFVGFANYSAIITKDVIFTGLFALCVCLFCELARDPQRFFSNKRLIIGLAMAIFFECLFRKNAIWATLLFLPFAIILLRDQRRKALIWLTSPLIAAALVLGPVSHLAGIKSGSVHEALSVPAVQLATVMQNPQTPPPERKFIESYILNWEALDPHLADSVKGSFNDELFQSNPLRFIKGYISIGLNHPLMYLDAFLRLSVGYWSPVTDYATSPATGAMLPYSTSYRQPSETYPADSWIYVDRTPLVPVLNDFFIKLSQIKPELHIPLIGWLAQAGSWIWIILFSLFYCLYSRRRLALIPALFALAYLLSVMFGPVSIFRYALPFAAAFPSLLALCLDSNQRREHVSQGLHHRIRIFSNR